MFVTVISFLSTYNESWLNALLEFRLEPQPHDANCVQVYTQQGELVGTVSSQPQTSLWGCQLSYDMTPFFQAGQPLYGTVRELGSTRLIPMGRLETALKVEIILPLQTSNSHLQIKGLFLPYPTTEDMTLMKELTHRFYAEQPLQLALNIGETIQLRMPSRTVPFARLSEIDNQQLEMEDLLLYLRDQPSPLFEVTNVTHEKLELLFQLDWSDFKHWQQLKKTLTYQEKIEKLASDGISSTQTLYTIVQYLQDCHVHPKDIETVLNSMQMYSETSRFFIPREPTIKYLDEHQQIKKCVAYINRGKHLILDGPSATGKNTLITTLCWIYQRPMYEISLNRQTGQAELLGDQTLSRQTHRSNLIPFPMNDSISNQMTVFMQNTTELLYALSSKGQEITFAKELVTLAMEEGGVLNLDEVNMANPAVLALLHSVLDNRRTINVPHYGCVKAHPNFVVIGTMNYGYHGTQELNTAFSRRFTHISFDYPESILPLLQYQFPNYDPQTLQQINQIYISLVSLIKNKKIPQEVMNIRGIITAIETDTIPLIEALEDNLVNVAKDEITQKAIQNVIHLCLPRVHEGDYA